VVALTNDDRIEARAIRIDAGGMRVGRRRALARVVRERSVYANRVNSTCPDPGRVDRRGDRRLYAIVGRTAEGHARRTERRDARADGGAAVSARVQAVYELSRHADLLAAVPGVPAAVGRAPARANCHVDVSVRPEGVPELHRSTDLFAGLSRVPAAAAR
jgi:hypothetical protein